MNKENCALKMVDEITLVISLSMLCICSKRRPNLIRSETSVNDDNNDDDVSLLYLTFSNTKFI